MTQSTRAAKIFGDREDPRRRLHDLFGGELPAGGQPPAEAITWAQAQLASHTETSEVEAVLVFRLAEPKLTLAAATFLARHVTRG